MASFNIISVNCRGLGNSQKRRDVFDFLKKKKSSIYCLQDTHFTEAKAKTIYSDWGSEIFNSFGQSDSRGVAILFGPNIEYKILKTDKDLIGNLLILDIEICRKYTIKLINVYGPNEDNVGFYDKINDNILGSECDFTIACGDWNLILDQQLDSFKYKHINNPKARKKIEEMCQINDLQDPFRNKNPKLRRFTWFRNNPIKKARLDYFLVSSSLLSAIDKIEINAGYRTDHSSVEINIKLDTFNKGKGFWKFNNSLLRDKSFVDRVKDTMDKTLRTYCLNMNEEPRSRSYSIDKALLFEMILMDIRAMTISFSIHKQRKERELENEIDSQINFLEETLSLDTNENSNHCLNSILKDLKIEHENIRKEKLKGLCIRSKVKWIEEGEKPTKFFCSLENRNYVNKTVTSLNTDNGLISEQYEILNEIENFYSNLYKSRDQNLGIGNLNVRLNNYNIPKISGQEGQGLQGKITVNEALKFVKKMKTGTTPGSDGFTPEFYKFFWNDIAYYLIDSINYALHIGELSPSQKLGIITILPKGSKSRELLSNWRPISLLNVSYKILSGCLAERMKIVLQKLIHDNQKGFLSGRFIGENTRLIYDVMKFTEDHQIPGILLVADFEKAFDSLSWRFLFEVLEFFKFPIGFIEWIKVITNNVSLCVIQNGVASKFFNISRGCKQGDPISPYLFILCVEILGILVRNRKDIKGISVNKLEIKLSQYADDTTLFLDGSENSLKSALNLLGEFAKFSGLKPNISKTTAIWIGSKVGSESICKDIGLTWTNSPIKILGIVFSANLERIQELNYDSKINEVQNLVENWKRRHLTIFGKITVIKSLILPKLTHLFISIPSPDQNFIKNLSNIFFRFLWGKTDRVARNTMIQDYEFGGCKMIHLESFIKSLKLTWIRRLIKSDSHWKHIFHEISKTKDKTFFGFGDYYYLKLAQKTKNCFWKEILEIYSDFIKKINSCTENVTKVPLWYNSNLKMGGKIIFFDKWFQKGIRFMCDLVDKKGNFLTYDDFCNQYDFKPDFISFYGIKKCIMSSTSFPLYEISQVQHPIIPTSLSIILKDNKGCGEMYGKYITSLKSEIKALEKWDQQLNENIIWKNKLKIYFEVIKDTKLLWFQYRINLRILATNKYLYNINERRNPFCNICEEHIEQDILHIIIKCKYSKDIWQHISNIISEYMNTSISMEEILFGKHGAKNFLVNIMIIVVKQCIYKNYLNNTKPYFPRCIAEVQRYLEINQEKIGLTLCEKSLPLYKWISKYKTL